MDGEFTPAGPVVSLCLLLFFMVPNYEGGPWTAAVQSIRLVEIKQSESKMNDLIGVLSCAMSLCVHVAVKAHIRN